MVYTGPVRGAGGGGPEDRRAEGLARRQHGAGDAAAGGRERGHRLDARSAPSTPLAELVRRLFRAGLAAAIKAPVQGQGVRMRGTFHHLRRRRGHRQVDPCGTACRSAQGAGHRGGADARAGRLARRRSDPPCAAVGRRQAARRRSRSDPVRGGARRSRRAHHRARPGKRTLGDLRPLRRFDPRLSGRARPRRSEAAPARWSGSRSATSSRISPSSSTCRPRSGWRARPSGAARAKPTVSRRRSLEFHEQLREAYPRLALERADALRADRRHRTAARRSPSASGRSSTTGSIRRPRRSRSKSIAS